MQISYSSEFLDQCRQLQDPQADAVIAFYFPERKQELEAVLSLVVDNQFEPAEDLPEVFRKLYEEVFKNKTLAQAELIYKGQQFFARHSSDILLLLGFLSLPYCYAAADGAAVLLQSKRIREEPAKRLLETGQFVFDVTAPDAFATRGKGLAAALKVRLMHAAVRYYISSGNTWSDKWGKPINQEDMAGTNLSFSLIVIRGLKKLGKPISTDEAMDYIRYWNLMGELLGLSPTLLPDTNKRAYLLERNIRQRQFRSSEAGQLLTKSLLDYFERALSDSPMSGLSKPFVHYLLGDELAGVLGIELRPLSAGLFKPFSQFVKLRNILMAQEDTYMAAFERFEKQRQLVSGNASV